MWHRIISNLWLMYLFYLISAACSFYFSEEKQKSIDIECICELLDLVLGSQFHAQVDALVEYLKVSRCICRCIFSLFTYDGLAITWVFCSLRRSFTCPPTKEGWTNKISSKSMLFGNALFVPSGNCLILLWYSLVVVLWMDRN